MMCNAADNNNNNNVDDDDEHDDDGREVRRERGIKRSQLLVFVVKQHGTQLIATLSALACI